jgi:hypothetical protein
LKKVLPALKKYFKRLFSIWAPLRATREEIKIKDNKIKRRRRRENIKDKSAALFMNARMTAVTYFKTVK